MKTFLRFAWPVGLTALIEYTIIQYTRAHLGAELRPLHWWSIAGSLLIVAGLQYVAYRQDRKHKLYLEQQRARIADMLKSDGGTNDPGWF